MSGRKTAPITYNLRDRGRKVTGVSRDNVNIPAMVKLINSPQVQELVKTSSLLGYYGHQIRARFGMTPPETVIIDGKTVRLEPAFKTIQLNAEADGTVTHQAEFLANNAGEFVMKQYQAKVGGFSTAVNFRTTVTEYIPTGFFGFDYVLASNYVGNAGDGQLYDGLYVPADNDGSFPAFDSATDFNQLSADKVLIASLLEQQIISTFDSINGQMALASAAGAAYDELAAAMEENQRLVAQQNQLARKRSLQAQRQEDLYTGLVHPVTGFDSAMANAEAILNSMESVRTHEEEKPLRIWGVNLPWGGR